MKAGMLKAGMGHWPNHGNALIAVFTELAAA
jgi:hypothetical protein